MEYTPSISDIPPVIVPSKRIEAKGTGSPVEESITVPVTVRF